MTEKQDKKNHSEARQIRKDAFRKLAYILAVLLIGVNTYQLSNFGGLVERVDQYNRGVVDELGAIKNDIYTFGTDLNEIRSFLLLPVKKYSFSNATDEVNTEEEKANSRTGQAVYAFLDDIVSRQSIEKNSKLAEEKIYNIYKDVTFQLALKNAEMKAEKVEDLEKAFQFKVSDSTGNALFALLINKADASVQIQSSLGTYKVKEQDFAKQNADIIAYFSASKTEVLRLKTVLNDQKNAFQNLMKEKDFVSAVASKKMAFNATPAETDDLIGYQFQNADKETLFEVSISRKDGQFILDGKSFKAVGELKAPLLEKINNADTSTAAEKMIRERKAELEGIFNEEAFKEMLKNSGLQINMKPREDYNKILYDVSGADGKVIFSFTIELSSGLYKVLQDNVETDLYTFMDNLGLKKKP